MVVEIWICANGSVWMRMLIILWTQKHGIVVGASPPWEHFGLVHCFRSDLTWCLNVWKFKNSNSFLKNRANCWIFFHIPGHTPRSQNYSFQALSLTGPIAFNTSARQMGRILLLKYLFHSLGTEDLIYLFIFVTCWLHIKK